MGDVIDMGTRRAKEARHVVWCLCWDCGHAHRFHGDEVLADAGSYEEFERRARCLVCGECVAVVVQPKPKVTYIRTG